MSYNPLLPAGQAAMAASSPVVIASNQSAVPVTFTGSTDVATQTTLALIKAKTDNIPALGQALAATSVPVILPTATITTLTPPAAITGFATSANQSTEITSLGTIAGAVSATHMQVDVLTAPTTAVTGTFWQATQPVSLATLPVTNAGTFAVQAKGSTAESSAIADNPINNGGTAVTAPKTIVHNGDAVGLVADTTGRLIIAPYSNPENFKSGATSDITGTTATTIIAGTASNFLYITQILVTNSHATVGTFVNLTEETSGTVLYTGYAAALGGGFSLTFPTPLRVPTAAKAIQGVCVTTGANVRISASGYISTL